MAMLATAIFDYLFTKSNISAMDRLVIVKFHTNIANGWLFMIQRNIMAIIVYSESYFDMFRGPFFSGHGVDIMFSLYSRILSHIDLYFVPGADVRAS